MLPKADSYLFCRFCCGLRPNLSLDDDGFPPKRIRLIKVQLQVEVRDSNTKGEIESFEVHSRVRQGYLLSPTLFKYAINWILRNTMANATGVQVSITLAMTDIAYTDDAGTLGEL